MATPPLVRTRFEPNPRAASLADQVSRHGLAVMPDALGFGLANALRSEADALWDEGGFRFARIGAGANKRLSPETRSDRVRWWDDDDNSEAQRAYRDFIERVRLAVNQRTFAGLFDWEGHYAVYLEGTGYRRHVDVFANAPTRCMTVIAYLNHDWQPADGGVLRIYVDTSDPNAFVDVEPRMGTVVAFESARFPHEVLLSSAPRYSLTGWFRTRVR